MPVTLGPSPSVTARSLRNLPTKVTVAVFEQSAKLCEVLAPVDENIIVKL